MPTPGTRGHGRCSFLSAGLSVLICDPQPLSKSNSTTILYLVFSGGAWRSFCRKPKRNGEQESEKKNICSSMKQKVLLRSACPQGSASLSLTSLKFSLEREPLSSPRAVQSHCWSSRNSQGSRSSVLAVGTHGREGLRLGMGWVWRDGAQNPRSDGPCSLPKTVLVEWRLRLKAIRLLLGDANLLWHEPVPWQVCPIPMCPQRIEQLCFIAI